VFVGTRRGSAPISAPTRKGNQMSGIYSVTLARPTAVRSEQIALATVLVRQTHHVLRWGRPCWNRFGQEPGSPPVSETKIKNMNSPPATPNWV